MSNPYFPFFPNDHLGDINLRGCHPAAKGIWWDMVCYMAQGSPFGYLRLDPAKGVTPPARPPGAASGVPRGTPHGGARGGARGTPGGVLQNEYNLPTSGSLEHELPRMLGLPRDLVEWALAHLESRQVFSRDQNRIIYCRRMVRWAHEREERQRRARDAYIKRHGNGSAGGPAGGQQSRPGGQPSPPHARASGTPGGGAHAIAPAPPRGVPGGPPLTNTLSKTNPTPLPPPRKRGRGADPEHVAQLVRERSKHA